MAEHCMLRESHLADSFSLGVTFASCPSLISAINLYDLISITWAHGADGSGANSTWTVNIYCRLYCKFLLYQKQRDHTYCKFTFKKKKKTLRNENFQKFKKKDFKVRRRNRPYNLLIALECEITAWQSAPYQLVLCFMYCLESYSEWRVTTSSNLSKVVLDSVGPSRSCSLVCLLVRTVKIKHYILKWNHYVCRT